MVARFPAQVWFALLLVEKSFRVELNPFLSGTVEGEGTLLPRP